MSSLKYVSACLWQLINYFQHGTTVLSGPNWEPTGCVSILSGLESSRDFASFRWHHCLSFCFLVFAAWYRWFGQWHVLISNSSFVVSLQVEINFVMVCDVYTLIVIEVPTDIMRDRCIQLFVSFCLKARNSFEFKSETADSRHLNGSEKRYHGPKIHRKVDQILVKGLNHPPRGVGGGVGVP